MTDLAQVLIASGGALVAIALLGWPMNTASRNAEITGIHPPKMMNDSQ